MSRMVDLSGGWDGIYNYPRHIPSTGFSATIHDLAGLLTGEANEISQERRDHGKTLHALIEGTSNGDAETFVKTYDDIVRARTPILYLGLVNDDKTEISGTWNIPDIWSGTFIMVRKSASRNQVELVIAEPVS